MRRLFFTPRFSLVTMIGAAALSLLLASGSISAVLTGACVVLLGAATLRNRDEPWA
ncbi:hypothetical protein V5F41_07685 [Xanthobacter autotrophicus]|uniref:hypothetical protein n=1 Tax=Xanthobacter autotrophicus TaxID=280 RepID=UPI00372AF4B7